MSNDRLVAVLAAAALLVVAAVAFQVAPAASTVKVSTTDLSDYYQRHAGSAIEREAVASDWFERHVEMAIAANVLDASDYFQRHPTVSKITADAAANDYFQRHQSFNPGSGMGLSDWFQRHPDSTSH